MANIRFTFLLLMTIVATLSDGSPMLKLMHKSHINGPKTRFELLTQMLQRDDSNGAAGASRLVAGSINGLATGQYLAKIKMGTPAQELLMVMDTASDITWVNCFYKGKLMKPNADGPVFNADKSKSFRDIQCGSRTCRAFPMDPCHTPQDTCAFNYRYIRGSVHGDLASETVTLDLTNGTTTQLHDVLVGCSDYSPDLDGATGGASGVLGLSYNKLSFQSKASKSFGSKLSYCLLDPLTPINTSSYLIFGSHQRVNIPLDGQMQYTKLVPGVHGSYYGVNITYVYVNGNRVRNMPSKALEFDNKGNRGGVIVDSGALGTYLVEEAYMPIIGALDAIYRNFTTIDQGPFEVCYTKGRRSKFPDAPKLKFVFRDGKVFEPHPESYVIVINESVTCLGFINFGPVNSPSVFGAMLQQRFFWELDLENNKLGFASSTCMAGS